MLVYAVSVEVDGVVVDEEHRVDELLVGLVVEGDREVRGPRAVGVPGDANHVGIHVRQGGARAGVKVSGRARDVTRSSELMCLLQCSSICVLGWSGPHQPAVEDGAARRRYTNVSRFEASDRGSGPSTFAQRGGVAVLRPG